jgi:Putative peptidoglycan binding domain
VSQAYQHLLRPAPVPSAMARAASAGAKQQVANAQQKLKSAGCYAGPIHGLMDNATRRGVQCFQRASGLPVHPSGQIDAATNSALNSNAAAASSPASRVAGRARKASGSGRADAAASGPLTHGPVLHSSLATSAPHAVATKALGLRSSPATFRTGAPPRATPGAVAMTSGASSSSSSPSNATRVTSAQARLPPGTSPGAARRQLGARLRGTGSLPTNVAGLSLAPTGPSTSTFSPGARPMASAADKHPAYWKPTGFRVPLIMAAAIAAGQTALITQLPQMDFRGENVVIDPTVIGPNCLVTVPTVGTNPQIAGGPAGTGIPGTMFSPNQCGALDFSMQISNQGNALAMSVTNTLTNATLNFACLIFGHEVSMDTSASGAAGGVAPAGAYVPGRG